MTHSSTARAPQLSSDAWRLIVLEFWERFSYYGILAILVLFLVGTPDKGGLGWDGSRALNLLSMFASIAFILPMIGGYAADRWLGAPRAVLIGSVLLVAGNLVVAIAAIAHASSHAATVLYAGLAAVALGNGFFKSSLVTLLGSMIEGDDSARDRAFRFYYQAVMLGALAASLCVGAIAESVGWWSGFALAALGMLISFGIYVSRIPSTPDKAATIASQNTERSHVVRHALFDVAILCVFLAIITVGWVQFQGSWLLQMESAVDRAVGAFVVPSSWLLAVNAIVVVLFTPMAGRLWRQIAGSVSALQGFAAQFAAAFALIGIAHLLAGWGFQDSAAASVSLAWPIGCVLLITVGELIFWPSSYNAIHRLAPDRSKSLLMGLWLATLGLGQYLTHQVGRSAQTIGFATMSTYIGTAMIVACVAIVIVARLRPTLRAL